MAKRPAAPFPAVVRIPAELRDRLARMAEALSKRALVAVPPASVVREAIERGLADLERDVERRK
jgi:predicted DNA-binding protein